MENRWQNSLLAPLKFCFSFVCGKMTKFTHKYETRGDIA